MLTRLERKTLSTKGINIKVDEQNSLISFAKNNMTLSYYYNGKLLRPVLEDEVLSFVPVIESNEAAKHLGTAISVSAAHLSGLQKPFTVNLVLKGTGFKVALKQAGGQNVLSFNLGKSHEDTFVVPANVKVTVPSATQVSLESADKYLLGQVSANIRALRKVDAYKGKGVLVEGQVVELKETKKK